MRNANSIIIVHDTKIDYAKNLLCVTNYLQNVVYKVNDSLPNRIIIINFENVYWRLTKRSLIMNFVTIINRLKYLRTKKLIFH
jgi:hypothetical protein